MKKIQRYSIYILGVLTLSIFNSCLKDNSASVNFNTSQPVIEQLTGTNYFNYAVNGGSLLANQNSYFLPIRVDSTGTFTDSIIINDAGTLIGKDINVTVGVDNTDFATFNNNNGSAFQVLPAADFSISSPTVTLKANQRSVSLYIKFNTKLIDFTQNNILPISITSVSGGIGTSGNYGTIMYEIVPANQYVGLYQSVGQRVEGTNTYSINDLKYIYDFSGITSFQGYFPTARAYPSTFVPNTVVTNCADQTIYLSFGEQMDLTVNSNNSVTVSNDNLYAFGVGTFSLVSGTSTYNPTNHTFTLNYSFVDPGTGLNSVVNETMTRIY